MQNILVGVFCTSSSLIDNLESGEVPQLSVGLGYLIKLSDSNKE